MSENREQKRCPLRLIASCMLPSAEGIVSETCIENRYAWWMVSGNSGHCAIMDIAYAVRSLEEK